VETLPVPVDDRGLLVDRLPDGPSGVLVTPAWQYPNGGTMPVARRMHLLDWAARNRAVVFEVDCD
jgi:GntR family transcriptional regulator/MocR family aminotransferase